MNQKHGTAFSDYPRALRPWSISDPAAFHGAVWEYFEVIHSQPYDEVVQGLDQMPGAKWFPGAKLNFAENLLRFRDSHTAIVFRSENGSQRSMTYAELYAQVAHLAAALGQMGVGPRRPGGGLHAQHPRNDRGHAGLGGPGGHLVLL